VLGFNEGLVIDMDLAKIVPDLLKMHPAVRWVNLVGSRSEGLALKYSDWDFLVDTTDFDAVSTALPSLTLKLDPLSHLWDPLSHQSVYMMILRGPTRVDIIFDHRQQQKPPWTVNSETIIPINSHFWDWILFIASKEAKGSMDIVSKELRKMYPYLLAPLGCTRIPDSVEEAVREFILLFGEHKRLFNIVVDPALETEVINGLKAMGFHL
jgi:hypothetical protein